MELHQLRYFLAVAQQASFTAAALACNVSQPTLSAQVAKLEDELGGALIERGRHGAKLTARGQLFRPRATDALQLLQLGRIELEELAGLKRGSLVLGCLPTTGAYLLPKILTAFSASYPKIQVNLREDSSPSLARAIRSSEVDLAITDDAGTGEGIASQVLFTEELLVAVPKKHRLADRLEVDLNELDGEAIILMKKGHGFRSIVLAALARAGVEPKVVYESTEIETVQALVEAGLGLSLVPRLVQRTPGPCYLRIKDPRPSRTVLLAWRDGLDLSPAAAAMKSSALACFP